MTVAVKGWVWAELRATLAGLTVFTSWLFTQVLFALHYAHDFYLCRIRGATDPLIFPGTPDPGYADFFHFACVIGRVVQSFEQNVLECKALAWAKGKLPGGIEQHVNVPLACDGHNAFTNFIVRRIEGDR